MQTRLTVFCDRVIEAGWLVAAMAVPLFFNIYSSRVFEPDKLTLLRSIALAMCLAWAIKALEGGDTRKRAAGLFSLPLLIPTLILVGVYLLTTATSIIPRVSLWGSYQRLQGTYTTLSYVVIFFLTLLTLKTRRQLDRIETKKAHIVVIRLGYVGLPLAVEFARSGFRGTGLEVDEERVASVGAGRSYIGDVSSEDMSVQVRRGKLTATVDYDVLKEADIIFICVPTPFADAKAPNLSYIITASEGIASGWPLDSWWSWRAPPIPAPLRRRYYPCLNPQA